MKWWWPAAALLVIVAGAFALRWGELDRRPLHNDEAVNAVKLSALWDHGEYRYDPHEYHGPAFYYAALPFLWLASIADPDQPNTTSIRRVTAVFGIGLILLLWLLVDGLGWPSVLWSAVFTALSPGMVFYSRYFIHELPLVFFSFLTIAAAWRYLRRPGFGWAILSGIGLGLMATTKETFVFALAAMVGGLFLAGLMPPPDALAASGTPDASREDRGPGPAKPWLAFGLRVSRGHWLAALAGAAIVWLVLFSSFFTNANGPLDSVRTYAIWTERAGGASPHSHPWYFYLERLGYFHRPRGPVWSELAILLLAAAGGLSVFAKKPTTDIDRTLGRFLVFYTLLLTLIYCVIPYKTPWCLLGFFHGMLLLAGIGAAALLRAARGRWARWSATALLVIVSGHLGWQAFRGSYALPADWRHPYAYAHTSPDILGMVQRVEELTAINPDRSRMLLKVIAPDHDYWPLPWYLRRFERVGWWDHLPEDPYAPVMIVSSRLGAALDEKSNKAWLMVGLFELRAQVFFELYVEFNLWKRYVESRPRPLPGAEDP